MSQRYWLSVDIGTENIVAGRSDSGGGPPRLLALTDSGSSRLPSVVHVRSPAQIVVGEDAQLSGLTDPQGLIAAPGRWITMGHTTVRTVHGDVSVVSLLAAVLGYVTRRAQLDAGGERPEGIVLVHPPFWQPAQITLLAESARILGYSPELIRTIDSARAVLQLHRSLDRAPSGTRAAVFDLGAGSLDVAVFTVDEYGYPRSSAAQSTGEINGRGFDDAIRRWAETQFAESAPEVVTRLTDRNGDEFRDLMASAHAAKEALSTDAPATIGLVFADSRREIGLTREQFESIILADVARAVDFARATLLSAGATHAGDIGVIHLAGGCTFIPAVQRAVRELCPAVTADEPGAAARGALVTSVAEILRAPDEVRPTEHSRDPDRGREQRPPRIRSAPQAHVRSPWQDPRKPRRRTPLIVIGCVIALALVAGAAAAAAWFSSERGQSDSALAKLAARSTLPIGNNPNYIALADQGVYIAGDDRTIWVVDPTTEKVSTVITVGKRILGLVADRANSLIFVGVSTGESDSALETIDTRSNTIVATIPLGHWLTTMSLDAADHVLYCAVEDVVRGVGGPATIVAVDTSTHAIVSNTPTSYQITRLAVDSGSHRLFALSGHNIVPMARNGQADGSSIPFAGTVYQMAVEPTNGTLHVLSAPGRGEPTDPGYHLSLSIVDIRGRAATKIIAAGSGSGSIVFDPSIDAEFIGDCIGTPSAGGLVLVLDTSSAAIVTRIPAGRTMIESLQLAVDTASHTLYALGADSLTVIGP
ncbi:Hsp70 family protein [Nocardia aurantia]|uniref:Chaperone protein DnaK n=1 Tax=Nocardia aurantia TaxID=2585199 RepID=A0A7K0DGS3_9NOCA|nr:Hsp70 family protein [Nocardia aurantia]MQY25005.1 Chaperone protein DnaK [Nocardia aurantia]